MGILNNLSDLVFKRRDREPAQMPFTMGIDQSGVPPPSQLEGGLMRSSSPPARGDAELLRLFRSSPWLRAVNHKIAFAFAGLEWNLYAQKGDPSSKKKFVMNEQMRDAEPMQRRTLVKRGLDDGTLEQVRNHPAMRVWNRPNELMTGRTLRHIGQIHVELLGETYLVLDTNNVGMPVRMWIVPPTWVREIPTEQKPWYTVDIDGSTFPVPATNMIAIRDPDPANPFGRGVGTGMSLADELDVDEFAAKHVATWFHNKGMPDMIVSMEGAQRPVLEQAKKAWDNALKGFRKAYRTHWTGAKLDVKRLDTAFKDMALIEIRTWERNTIIQVSGVPPEKMGIIDNSNRSTSEASHFIFANDVIVPRAELWKHELQFKFIERFDPRLLIDYVSPVPGDREFTRSVMQAFSEVFTIDEIRALADQPPLPDDKGKAHIVTSGKSYVPDLSKLSTPPVYGYHLAAGVLTNNEVRASLALEPAVGDWGNERSVGLYMDPNMFAAGGSGDFSGDVAMSNKVAIERAQKAALALPPRRVVRTLSAAAIEAIINSVKVGDLSKRIDPVVRALVESWGKQTITAIDDGLTFDMNDPAVEAHLREYAADRLGRLINTTTTNELRVALEEVAAGNGDREESIAAVRRVFDRAEVERSDAIAESEVRRSSMFTSKVAMTQSGIVVESEWMSTQDGRAREEHLQMDGQRRALDDKFEIVSGRWSGARALHPGGFGVASLDINCRCAIGAVVAADDDADAPPKSESDLLRRTNARASGFLLWRGATEGERADVWRTLDRKLEPWDSRYARAIAGAFRTQERAAVDAVDANL